MQLINGKTCFVIGMEKPNVKSYNIDTINNKIVDYIQQKNKKTTYLSM